jgi:hypothetical protein
MLTSVLVLTLLRAQPAAPQPELYRFVIVQAAPGRLLELIDLYKKRIPVMAAGGDDVPYIVRHSQGTGGIFW